MVTIRLTPKEVELCHKHAVTACVGGKSQFKAGKKRKDELYEDQLTGQIGNLALSLYMFGSDEAYIKSRQVADENPTLGIRYSRDEHRCEVISNAGQFKPLRLPASCPPQRTTREVDLHLVHD